MDRIIEEIKVIARCLDTLSNTVYKDFQLSRGQYLYLIQICEHPGMIQEKIAEVIKVDRTTAARAIKKLEISEFIIKVGDKENRKIKKLFPTEKGKELYKLIEKKEKHFNASALQSINIEEQQLVLNLIQRIRGNIEIDWQHIKKGSDAKTP
ncbi:MarR family winged helix-turn-helix transcriptional regulator [Peribacillus sp. FSL R5-0717]|uniref:MarR family winged helix-turn-helix transcriptional regulator n=1 Tax=Peribacillus sp. FSL R5-0717 TaxID=2975308 RepID=UPI0030F89DA9